MSGFRPSNDLRGWARRRREGAFFRTHMIGGFEGLHRKRFVELPPAENGGIIAHHLRSGVLDDASWTWPPRRAAACRRRPSPSCAARPGGQRRRGMLVTLMDVQEIAFEARPQRDDAMAHAIPRRQAAHVVVAALGVDLQSVTFDANRTSWRE